MKNTRPTAEDDDALMANDNDDDEDASSRDEEGKNVAEQQLPILTSPITDGRRY